MVRCNAVWVEHFGDAAQCAQPRYYFADSTCGITKVRSFECRKGKVANVPNTTMYEQMSNLGCIDLSDNPQVRLTATTTAIHA